MSQTEKKLDETDMRRLRFRLKRQGMAELDTWLAPLEIPLKKGDRCVAAALAGMLDQQPPELVAMMRGELLIPGVLQPWLNVKSRIRH